VILSHFPCILVFSPYSRSYSVHFSLSTFFSVSWHISCHTVFASHFPRFIRVFLPYSRSYNVYFSFFRFFSVSPHISLPKVCVSHFLWLSVSWPYSRSYTVHLLFSTFFQLFLAILQVPQCLFLIFCFFSVFLTYSRSYSVHFSFPTFFGISCHISCHIVFTSHFPRFSVSSPYSRSYNFISHFSRFSVFLSIFHFLQFVFLIFHDFQFSGHTPGPTLCISHFPLFSIVSRDITGPTVFISHFLLFFSFLAIFQVLQCAFLIFHHFQCSSPYFTSYNVSFSFSNDFQFSCHDPGPTVCIFHFLPFSVFLTIFQITVFMFYLPRFSVFSPYSRSYSVPFSFYMFFSAFRHIQGQTVFVSH
jgi:hypothetical protein